MIWHSNFPVGKAYLKGGRLQNSQNSGEFLTKLTSAV